MPPASSVNVPASAKPRRGKGAGGRWASPARRAITDGAVTRAEWAARRKSAGAMRAPKVPLVKFMQRACRSSSAFIPCQGYQKVSLWPKGNCHLWAQSSHPFQGRESLLMHAISRTAASSNADVAHRNLNI